MSNRDEVFQHLKKADSRNGDPEANLIARAQVYATLDLADAIREQTIRTTGKQL